jgi:hypothetical protein
MSGPRYLLVPEVAERYGVSEWTIREWAKQGRLPHRRRPHELKLRFPEHELDLVDDGAELELVTLAYGGRICRPRKSVLRLEGRP